MIRRMIKTETRRDLKRDPEKVRKRLRKEPYHLSSVKGIVLFFVLF